MGHAPQEFDSNQLSVPAVKGVNTGTPLGAPLECVGVAGESNLGVAVAGHSESGFGVHGFCQSNFGVRAASMSGTGLRATTVSGEAAIEADGGQSGTGVFSAAAAGPGVHGTSGTSDGVLGEGPVGVYGRDLLGTGNGVIGYSDAGRGVWGHSNNTGTGVLGESAAGPGVHGTSGTSDGVLGEGPVGVYGRDLHGTGNGVIGYSDAGRGVWGHGMTGIGVLGEIVKGVGVRGNSIENIGGFFEGALEGVHGKSSGGPAGYFEGSVVVTGDISLGNADCAEDFQVADGSSAEPGTVMVLDNDSNLRASASAYDKRVAGVISGGGSYKPGIVLDRQQIKGNRKPVALLGKVFCKADAQFGSIEVGDLLTTSPTSGHAMRVDDPLRNL